MARRHLIQYFVELESNYSQMLEDVNELEKSYKNGNMDYERYAQLRDTLTPDVEAMRDEYERLSYVMFLLNIPNRVKKEDKYKKENQTYFAYLDKFSKENVIDESKDVLKNFKEQVKKYKEEDKWVHKNLLSN